MSIRHVDTCNAQTGPIFLAYRSEKAIDDIVSTIKTNEPEYSFVSDDGISHNVWVVNESSDIEIIRNSFNQMNQIYIADGHHRAASAVKVGLMRREEDSNYASDKEYNSFLSVLFPDNQLKILPYNRVVKDLNGQTLEEVISRISNYFDISESSEAYLPKKKGTFGMFAYGKWYELIAKEEICDTDPVKGLDVSILQDNILKPIFGINDPRTDKRIDFVGGIRGLSELERRATSDMKIAFSMYPTSIEELFSVADANMLMPPKSTWFEPKLRSGIFIHKL